MPAYGNGPTPSSSPIFYLHQKRCNKKKRTERLTTPFCASHSLISVVFCLAQVPVPSSPFATKSFREITKQKKKRRKKWYWEKCASDRIFAGQNVIIIYLLNGLLCMFLCEIIYYRMNKWPNHTRPDPIYIKLRKKYYINQAHKVNAKIIIIMVAVCVCVCMSLWTYINAASLNHFHKINKSKRDNLHTK